MVEGKLIGLTGNIACGKSSVAKFLAELGVPVIDADQIAREVTAPGSPALTEVAAAFGPGVLDAAGGLDRQAVRQLVFRDETKRKQLEGILHPAILKRTNELVDGHFAAGRKLVVYEASLIVEAGRHGDFQGLLVVTCDGERQKQRLLSRDARTTAELAERMIAAQLPQSEKTKHATWVIENNGSLEDLRKKVQDWYATSR